MDKPPGAAPRSTSADYPVDPAERMNQEARLRKAAAAGASSLKSPIPLLRSPLPSSVAEPQKAADTQAASIAEKAPNIAPTLISEIPEDRKGSGMKDTEEILAELRKISAWANLQRKATKWSLIFAAIFIPVVIGGGVWMEQREKTNLESRIPSQPPDWYEVERNVRLGDFEKAIAIGEELLLKTPQYPEAHHRLAGAYLASGNLEKAKQHYAEAFRLFPSEENEKLLSAIEKRIKADSP